MWLLRQSIQRYNYLYHVKGDGALSDEAYDALRALLSRQEADMVDLACECRRLRFAELPPHEWDTVGMEPLPTCRGFSSDLSARWPA